MTAAELHKEAFVLDSHCDTPLAIIRGQDVSKRRKLGHIDFDRLKDGGVDGVFFAAYTSNSLSPDEATRRALQLIALTHEVIDENPKKVGLATSVREARKLKAEGRTAIFIGLENGSPIQKDLSLLKLFYKMGVRYMTLTHAGNNEICDSCAPKEKRWGGGSPFGKEVIEVMNRLGMMIDVSHLSDESFYDCLKYSKAPIVATHSCCRALCNHPRNMTDEMIRHLAEAGGVIQINFYPLFLDGSFKSILNASGIMEYGERIESEFIADPANPEKRAAWNRVQDELEALMRPSYKLIADHIDHVVDLVGIDHVGLGSDYDGIEVTPLGMEDISMMHVLFDELRSRGYTDSDLSKIASDNFFRIL